MLPAVMPDRYKDGTPKIDNVIDHDSQKANSDVINQFLLTSFDATRTSSTPSSDRYSVCTKNGGIKNIWPISN